MLEIMYRTMLIKIKNKIFLKPRFLKKKKIF